MDKERLVSILKGRDPLLADAVSQMVDYIQDKWAAPYPSKEQTEAVNAYLRSGFGGSGSHGDIFHDDEAAGIKEFMNEYAETREEMLAVGNWLVGYSGIKGRLTNQERNRAQKEVDDVAEGRYDWRIERGSKIYDRRG